MKIVVIGLGYIGLPTAIMFANKGHRVIGVDVNESVIKKLNNADSGVEEPFLQKELEKAVKQGNFIATTEIEPADAFIITVPTPSKGDLWKSCDLTYVIQAVTSILPYLRVNNTVVIESTVAPKTTESEILPLIESVGLQVGENVHLLHCPERVLPGRIIHELVHNDRIIGGVTPSCTEAGIKLYQTFAKGRLIPTDAATAELTKLMENTFRDVNIALANELVKVGETLAIDALKVIELANHHPRVNIHQPGPGVGGHCLAIDPNFIVATAPFVTQLIKEARSINESMPMYILSKVEQIMTQIGGRKITIFGLAYKGNSDDTRESPAMTIYQALQKQVKYEVVAFDPHVSLDFVEKDIKTALTNSDLLLVLTDHSAFQKIASKHTANMRNKLIFDTKGIVKHFDTEVSKIHLGNMHTLKEVSIMRR
ncbi:nucleotide sugar dehydrogenase [Listeria booriae]|uniref:Nucleotide sugar dehydrogenase n=1 Tax=Listeria booriae TaxID=1552123 RepID=A0A841Y654_9LIST|nr:nucleotide sugar dehydrogenase [Listeria booriae]MBC1371998.1 nucleotide sugar dehydrogenase [Listeria booriae]